MTIEELDTFLRSGASETYANKDAPKVASLRPESEDYHFEKGNLAYHDTYFGARDFIGEEVVYESGVPVWGSNYYGRILIADASKNEVYAVLRLALMNKSDDCIPVRGPKNFSYEDWEYECRIEGTLAAFEGEETISRGGKRLYRALLHGGFIS